MATDWYILFDDRPLGPFTFGRLKSLAVDGQVTPETLVSQAGMHQWLPAKQIQGIFELGDNHSTPPPIPQAAAEAMPVIDLVSRTPRHPSPRTRRPKKGGPTVNVLLGCFGAAALVVGACCPVLRLPIVGGMSYFGFARLVVESGVQVENIDLLAAPLSVALALATTAIAAFSREQIWFWVPSFFACLAPLITLGRFLWTQHQIAQHIQNPGAPLALHMADLVALEFGFAVLAIGGGLLVAAAVVPVAQRV